MEGTLPSEGAATHMLAWKFAALLRRAANRRFSPPGARCAPFDAGRLSRQGMVPPAAAHRVPGGELKRSANLAGGRDPGTGSRPGPDQDGPPRADGVRRAGVVRGRPTAWFTATRPGAAATVARGCSRGSRTLNKSTASSGYHQLRRSDRPGGGVTVAACLTRVTHGLKEVSDNNGSAIARLVWSVSPSSMRLRIHLSRASENHP